MSDKPTASRIVAAALNRAGIESDDSEAEEEVPVDESNIVPFRQPGDMEARFNLRPEVPDDPETLTLFCEVKEEDDSDFKVIARRYPRKRWINEKGWRVSGSQPGDKRNRIEIERVPELNDDDPFVFQGFQGEVLHGHLKEIVSTNVGFTVGDVRRWRDNPNRCQCENCLHVFPRAVGLLALLEDWAVGNITRKRMEIKLRKLGYDDFVETDA